MTMKPNQKLNQILHDKIQEHIAKYAGNAFFDSVKKEKISHANDYINRFSESNKEKEVFFNVYQSIESGQVDPELKKVLITVLNTYVEQHYDYDDIKKTLDANYRRSLALGYKPPEGDAKKLEAISLFVQTHPDFGNMKSDILEKNHYNIHEVRKRF